MGNDLVRTLLIEDNPGDARLIEEVLKDVPGFSFTIECKKMLAQGLARLKSTGIDVVVLDLTLPDSHGYETFQKLHSLFPETPVVLLTGLEDEQLGVRAVREGAQDYLVKGNLDGNLLARAIRYALERKRSADALRKSEQLFEKIYTSLLDAVFIVDARSLDITNCNPAATQIFGFTREEIIGLQSTSLLVSGLDFFQAPVAQIESNGQEYGVFQEITLRRKDGNQFYAECSVVPLEDNPQRIRNWVVLVRDITTRKRAEEQLLHDAFHDLLTGLPNRALFLDRLGRAIGHSKRVENYLFAVLFLDLDRFKIINDSLGHAIGDQLLSEISKVMKACLDSGDTIARFGGDEFIILLEDIQSTKNAILLAERIQKVLGEPLHIGEHQVFTSSSIGIVLSTGKYSSAEEMIRDADIAMHQAKMKGKSQYVVFDIEMRNHAIARLDLENHLRHALERGEFEIHYQPIISLRDNSLAGFEALLRWHHPQRGMISPAEFIPIAEETGLIVEIGYWLLEQTCAQRQVWVREFPAFSSLQLSINVSQKQFNQPELLEQIQMVLDETGLAPRFLNLEITENMLMKNAESVVALLNRLREIGVGLHIDDFGTGYSSLSYLQQFPIDTLKIDSSFVNRIGKNGDKAEIVKTIILLARELGVESIAEGVETHDQFEQLRTLGCQYAQGYFIRKPMPPGKVLDLLEQLMAHSIQVYQFTF